MRANRANRRRALRGLSAILAGVISSLVAQSALAQDALCKVETVFGRAEIVTDSVRQPLAKGSPVAVQDQIETSEDSRVTLLCPDDLRITIGPISEVVLAQVDDAETGWAAILPRGIARFARPLFGGSRFEVRTPSAVASVRSTVWVVGVTEGTTSVFVSEGAVDVSASSGSVSLAAGQGVDVTAQGAVSEISAWSETRIEQLSERLAVPTQ